MKIKFLLLWLSFLFLKVAAAQFSGEKLPVPESMIDIPILLDLKPVYALAEKNAAAVYTSPNYPTDWIQADCATRYKYYFRRSPFTINTNGNRMNLGFTGSYKIIGSTRACLKGTVLSPWTPPCRCGFEEGERKVGINFTTTFSLLPNYILRTNTVRDELKAIDNCEVCFWGQNITSTVLDGVQDELDVAVKTMNRSFGTVNLRPYMQSLWQKLNEAYPIAGMGYFALRPKSIRMENLNAVNDFLNIKIGITASPVVQYLKPEIAGTVLPDISGGVPRQQFNVNLEGAFQYDSLSNILKASLNGKRFEVTEGIIKNHIIVEDVSVAGGDAGKLRVQLKFKGSFEGTADFMGSPVYDPLSQTIVVDDLEYDLDTRNLLLKTARWLFSKKIKSELQKYTRFNLSDYYSLAQKAIGGQLNKEWMKGVKSFGEVSRLQLLSLEATPDHLLVRSSCSGKLGFVVSELNFDFNH